MKLATSVEPLVGMSKTIISNLFQYFEANQNTPKKLKEFRQKLYTVYNLFESSNLTLIASEN